MKKRVHEWLPMVLIAWYDKLRISLKYLKQFFLVPRFCKSLKSLKRVDNWSTNVAVETRFFRAKTGGDLS